MTAWEAGRSHPEPSEYCFFDGFFARFLKKTIDKPF